MRRFNTSQGFTLIEVLIYSAIVGSFLLVAFLIVNQLINFSDRLYSQRGLDENQRFIVQKLNWILSDLESVNSPTLGESGSVLSVNKLSFANNPLVLDVVDGALRLTSGLNPPVVLSNDYARVSNLRFDQLDFSGQSAVRMTATLEGGLTGGEIDTTIIYQ